MKKRIFLFATVAALLTIGCTKDDITTVSDSTSTSSEDDEGDDPVTDVTATDTVTVVFSTSGSATVSGTGSYVSASVSGNGVTIVNSGEEVVCYKLSGSTSDGFFKLYSEKKQIMILNSVSITNTGGAAINIQGPQNSPNSGKKTYVVIKGSNSLTDGSSYTSTPSTEDEKGCLFSEGKLVLSGNGSLTVTAKGGAGICSDDYVTVQSNPTLTVSSSAGHGIRGKDMILIESGTLDISTSASMKKGMSSDSLVRFDGGETTIKVTGSAAYDSEDKEYTGTAGVKADVSFVMNNGTLTVTNSGTGGKGISCDGTGYFNGGTVKVTVTGSNYTQGDISSKGIKCDGNLTFAGSTVTVNCSKHEGIEAKGAITVSGGEVYSYSASDDAINSASTFTISGGKVCGYATKNDGLDANGNFYITGGLVYAIGASSPEVAIDANTEGGYKLYVQGGTLIAIGGLEHNSSLTQSCYRASSWSKNTWYALTTDGGTYAFKTPSSGGSPLVVSGSGTPTLSSGVTVSDGTEIFEGMMYTGASTSGGTSVSLTSYSSGNGGGPGGGGGPWGK